MAETETLFKVNTNGVVTCALTDENCGCGNICNRCIIPAAAAGSGWADVKDAIQ